MTSRSSRRPLGAYPILIGAVLFTACGAPSGGQGTSAPSSSSPGSSLSAGETGAPGFSLLDTHGKTVALADFKGKVVFVDFWATWCPPCRVSLPEVERLYDEYQGKAVQVLGMNLDENPGTARRFAENKKMPYPVLLAGDSDVSSAYGVEGIPHFALIDQEGKLVNSWSGFSPAVGAEWRAAINKLLGV